MAKPLCKLRRHDIADNLSEITRLVVQPQFLCRSCARSAAEKSSLCKPLAISHHKVTEADSNPVEKTVLSKKVLKKAKRETKKQKKYQKQLHKVLKKRKKMVKKHQKLEKEFARINLSLLNLGESCSNQSIH